MSPTTPRATRAVAGSSSLTARTTPTTPRGTASGFPASRPSPWARRTASAARAGLRAHETSVSWSDERGEPVSGGPSAVRARRACEHRAVERPNSIAARRVFDSGVGGLTVLHECLVSLPHEDFVYLGDTARFPYGEREPDELLAFSRELAGVLLDDGAKLLVIACNSATAAAASALREELAGRVDVVSVVTPGVAAGRAGHPQRAGGAAGHHRHGEQRRVRPCAGRGGARRRAARDRRARPGPADPGGRRGGRARDRHRRGGVHAADRGGRGHRDPRLHPLPARAARAAAARWAAGSRWCPRARRSPRRWKATCARTASLATTETGAATIASWLRATPTTSGGWGCASCSCRSARCATWTSRSASEPARAAA